MARIKKININVGEETTSLNIGDLCTEDFKSLKDPSATVKSLVAWAKELNLILKGITNAEGLAKAAGVPDATSFNAVISALSSKGITENSTVGEAATAAAN